MKLRKLLGDNRDHGKGFIFHRLSFDLHDFHVDPMVTDDDLPVGPERTAHIEEYRRFLRLSDAHRIVNAEINYNGNAPVIRNGCGESYFRPHVESHYDLFLDPDKGVGDGGREHVPIRAISELVPAESKRVLLVHVSSDCNDAESTWRGLLDETVGYAEGRHQVFLCDLGGNGILFIANKWNDRVRFMRGSMRCVFGPVAELRIRS